MSKKKSKYYQVSLCLKTVSSSSLKSRGRELSFFVALEKWKTLDLLNLITSLNCLKRDKIVP